MAFKTERQRKAAFAKKGKSASKPKKATLSAIRAAKVRPHGGKAVLLDVPGEGPSWFAIEDPELVHGEPSLVVAPPLPGGGPPTMGKPDNGWAYVGNETDPDVYHLARKLLGMKPDPTYAQDMGSYFDFQANPRPLRDF